MPLQGAREATNSVASDPKVRPEVSAQIRALTNCVLKNASTHPNVGRLLEAEDTHILIVFAQPRCRLEVDRLEQIYDQYYGRGSGKEFIEGQYAQRDLPRALTERLWPEVTKLRAEAEKERAARAAAETEKIARSERNWQSKNEQVFTCTRDALASLVSSSETANMLGSAAMTLCNQAIESSVEAALDHLEVKSPGLFNVSERYELKTKLRDKIRESVLAQAVAARAQANAGPTRMGQGTSRKDIDTSVSSTSERVVNCLTAMSQSQKGKLTNRDALVRAMLELCRPEIESAARAAYINDKVNTLERAREITAAAALKVANDLIAGR